MSTAVASTRPGRIATAEEFAALVESIERRPGYRRPAAFAVGLASYGVADVANPAAGPNEKVLDVYYPVVNLQEHYGSAALLAELTGYLEGSATYPLERSQLQQALDWLAPFVGDGQAHPNTQLLQDLLEGDATAPPEGPAALVPRRVVVTFIGDLAAPPVDAYDVYLRLHLLSHRKVQPHGLNLDGAFGLLNNVVWTNLGPFDPETFERLRLRLRARGVPVLVHAIDKFPRLADYVIPSGVRIADADRVRLGAHLAPGTTVMHEGFCNFNAGTLGRSMVEGRISAGVVVDDGSDIGGGASIMGTLSGGGKVVVRVGKNCLLGANSGLGIPLGDNCTIEAGLYVTAGMPVKLPDGRVVKARELAGQNDLLFLRHSQTGEVLVRHKQNQVVLNEALHANQ